MGLISKILKIPMKTLPCKVVKFTVERCKTSLRARAG